MSIRNPMKNILLVLLYDGISFQIPVLLVTSWKMKQMVDRID